MKVGVLALQGAFREQVETLEALGADATLVKTPEQLGGGRRDRRCPGGESTTMDKLLDSSGLAHAVARRAPRRHAGAGGVRGAHRARGRGASTAGPTSSRSACSTSPCAATATAASGIRSRPISTSPGLDRRPVPGRLHPGAGGRAGRPGRRGAGRRTTARRCSGATAHVSVRYVSSRARRRSPRPRAVPRCEVS